MAGCKGTTKRGTECRLNALKGSDYCAIHLTQDPDAPSGSEAIEDLENRLSEKAKAVLGIAIMAGIVLRFLIKRS